MKKPASNLLVKIAVPVVVVGAIMIGVKSCTDKNDKNEAGQKTSNVALKDLTPEDLKALGVEGDTAQDTLRTLVGSYRKVQGRLDSLESDNKTLADENKELKKNSTNVDQQISQAVGQVRSEEAQKRAQLSSQVTDLSSQVNQLLDQLKNGSSGLTAGNKGNVAGSDIPVGLGYDNGLTGGTGNLSQTDGNGLQWVEPKDGIATDANGRPVSDKNSNNATGFSFATSFGAAGDAARQATSAVSTTVQNNIPGSEKNAAPVYTLPENSTLVGSRAMTALLGRIPIDGKVTDPYPFKVMIGKDNLTANGIELPDVQGAIVSGTATGDWTLSCVRGAITSITFVFTDGTVRTLPSLEGQGSNGGNQNSQGGNNSSIGWLSDDNGIPCISGTRKSNASTYLPTIAALAAASAAGDAVAENQNTSQTNGYGGVTSTLTGDAGQAVLGKALSGGMRETVDWVKARYGQTFDAIYVPPGQKVALHITRQLAIDYEEKGRKVKYDDFSLAGSSTGMD
ncbi:TIGR03752 family integrating conjugative element protein [Citrobacter farmeri]|uniref:Bacterial conjugation TrbI-like family protein n=1 Tax=Citrobacter amalonaticus Y19 TaxID=1261127 RepID=A0A0F6TYY1_CITAM|nr:MULTISPECIES: TIGR03752 family integrating conjugative element protein [Citrobacter]AKE61296.1 bacterial conjugation TrbI-like family protein [Citrobacter amalonaticus Y19]EKV5657570.1 TIGR03752 family integrating conjugative element protein [Citrobacter farmeri]TCC76157.1 TIGR03752 family integrating conjugative element protein [Citrobacter braakii]